MSTSTDLIKKSCLNKSKFSSGFALFKYVKKKNFSVYFCALFWGIHFLANEEIFSVNFPEKFFKTIEKHSLALRGSFWGQIQVLLIFLPFTWFEQKKLFKQIQIFVWIYPFQTFFKKKKNSEYFSVPFWVFQCSFLR